MPVARCTIYCAVMRSSYKRTVNTAARKGQLTVNLSAITNVYLWPLHELSGSDCFDVYICMHMFGNVHKRLFSRVVGTPALLILPLFFLLQ